MNLIISLLFIGFLKGSNHDESQSIKDSYKLLLNATERIHVTPHITNLIRNGQDLLDYYQPHELKELGLKIIGEDIIPIDPTDLNEFYDSENFRIYYTTQGDSAVENLNYVQNMANIFENVYLFFIDTLGYQPPINGPSVSHNRYEIYVEKLPPYYFGVTYTKNVDVQTPSCASFIKMRNNYSGSQFDEHTEIENIQVTAVHEFFHAIQFSYNCYEKIWLMEATAVWSEDELYNDINDLYRYMPSWFANNHKSINDESNHMYGSFIYFQYIDEHLGGPETIRLCWEKSHEMASPIQDNSIDAVDAALYDNGSSFEQAYLRMRIANKIMNSNAGIYSYQEADGYLSAGCQLNEENIFYQKNNALTEEYKGLDRYESKYYNIISDSPVELEIIPNHKKLSMTSVIKIKNQQQWSIKTDDIINFDPELNIDWISIIISALDYNGSNWDYVLNFNDGYSEDFTAFHPYPNPSFGAPVTMDIQVINSQTISTKIVNILGKEIWRSTSHYSEPGYTKLIWNGKNNYGAKVSNGLYIVETKGANKNMKYKIVIIKNN